MNRRLFVFLVIMMSLSLIGIIFVQAYYISNSISNSNQQFAFNVNKALTYTSEELADIEYKKYVSALADVLAKDQKADSTALNSITVYKQDLLSKQYIVYNTGILEENFKVPSLIDSENDSLGFYKYSGKSSVKTYANNSIDGGLSLNSEASFERILNMDRLQKATFEAHYKSEIKSTPIHFRVSSLMINQLLLNKLGAASIELDFEFGIYDMDQLTSVKSENFISKSTNSLSTPIFLDENNESQYQLYVNFPKRNRYVYSSVIGIILLSFLFTVIIIIAYTSALYQLIKQRKISQIKTDFINNMTHEFKTPIATINLALDAIKNPLIIKNPEKIMRYLVMIKDENSRMNAQVENVLRISQLQKNQLNIEKDPLEMHPIIEDAITHVSLIVEDRVGYIKTHFNAKKTTVLANTTYMTSVIVNILDNAVKYSTSPPEIDITTNNNSSNIFINIKDKGNGMTKAVQKRIFEEFYREPMGNLHNVKGHGLGLSNVKRILENHQGSISVQSEKGKGSIFKITLPLIS